MIALSTLAKAIQDGLNANTYGVVYKIHTDAGTYKEALKTQREQQLYTNGVLQIVSSSVVPAQSLVIASQQARLEICVQLPYPAQDGEILARHRNILDGYFSDVRVDALTDESGKKYSVGSTAAVASSGSIESRPTVGTSFVFVVNIGYAFIQNGLNSYNCTFTLDGFPLPYTSATITRRPTVEANVYSNREGVAECVNTDEAVSFDFQIPAQSDGEGLSAILLRQIISGGLNRVHTLEVTLGEISNTYRVVFGQTDIVVRGVDGAGHNLSFVQAGTPLEESDGGL